MLFILLSTVYAFPAYIKLYGTDKYIGSLGRTVPKLVNKMDADFYEIDRVGNSLLEVTLEAVEINKVFDIEGNNKRLIYYPLHGYNNQQFQLFLDYSGAYRIMSNGLCMEYNELELAFMRETCRNDRNQLFDIETPAEYYESNDRNSHFGKPFFAPPTPIERLLNEYGKYNPFRRLG